MITDFAPGLDVLAITAASFGGGLVAGTLAAGRFVSHASNLVTSATGTGQFIYNSAIGLLPFDADGQGGAASLGIATLTTRPALMASDLIIQ
jgi:Ca2+-binding RTX toxin-like protein